MVLVRWYGSCEMRNFMADVVQLGRFYLDLKLRFPLFTLFWRLFKCVELMRDVEYCCICLMMYIVNYQLLTLLVTSWCLTFVLLTTQ